MDIQVKVFSGVSSMEKDTKLFERIVEVHEDVEFPFQKVLDVMHVLYKGSLVQFNVV